MTIPSEQGARARLAEQARSILRFGFLDLYPSRANGNQQVHLFAQDSRRASELRFDQARTHQAVKAVKIAGDFAAASRSRVPCNCPITSSA